MNDRKCVQKLKYFVITAYTIILIVFTYMVWLIPDDDDDNWVDTKQTGNILKFHSCVTAFCFVVLMSSMCYL